MDDSLNPSWPVFLGVCNGVHIHGEGVFQDFFRVSDLLITSIFPVSLESTFLLCALPFRDLEISSKYTFILRDAANFSHSARRDMTISRTEAPATTRINGIGLIPSNNTAADSNQLPTFPLLSHPDQNYKLVPIPCPPFMAIKPCSIDVHVEYNGTERKIGAFGCQWIKPRILSIQERNAIFSRPESSKSISFRLECKSCGDTKEFYETIDDTFILPPSISGATKLTLAPEHWICKCSKTTIPLLYMKDGVWEMFRTPLMPGETRQLTYRPLYENNTIAAIRRSYEELIAKDTKEEEIQAFIAKNQIIWHFLSPARIWNKPPILTKYNADFGILTTNGTLLLIELEKPQTILVKKDSGMSAELQKGIDQLRKWKQEVDNHRSAFLNHFGLNYKDVHSIKYVLIAGRSNSTSHMGLSLIRADNSGVDQFYCFDDLTAYLYAIEQALANLP